MRNRSVAMKKMGERRGTSGMISHCADMIVHVQKLILIMLRPTRSTKYENLGDRLKI